MIRQALEKIVDVLLKIGDAKLQGMQLSMPEAQGDYVQGTYFEQLATQHHHDYLMHHTINTSDLSPIDYRNAMWNFLTAALKGHKEAQYRIGMAYLNAELGLDRNYELAHLWLSRAATQGHVQADNVLKHAYEEIAL